MKARVISSYWLFTKQTYKPHLFRMSAKKSSRAKVLKAQQVANQKGSSEDVDSPNLSAIERDSFLESLQTNHGNPLHSTALEEDLKASENGRINKAKDGRKEIPQSLKTTGEQRGAAVKRKKTERNKENKKEEDEKKMSRTSTRGKVKNRPEAEGETKEKKMKEASQKERGQLDEEMKTMDPSADHQKKPAEKKSARQTSAAMPVKNQTHKGKKKESKSKSGESSDPPSQEESDAASPLQASDKVLLSDEDLVDEDMSWNPSPKKARVHSLGRSRKSSSDRSKTRKSSSGSTSAEAESADKQRRNRHSRQGGTELEVVLDAFLDFCDQYRESVESKAVKQSIDSFSSNVKGQLMEKISSYKELKVLKRENAKVRSLIRSKTQRLFDAKYELMRAERQAGLLQKENTDLKLRLADLKQGQAFLHDIRELSRQYLDFRHKHPQEKETYGTSSLPALLLETKLPQAAKHLHTGVSNHMEQD